MAQLEHWSVTCTTCDSPAEYHCNTCGDILCPRCREIHLRSRGTGHHFIVSYSKRVEPDKQSGQCGDHPDYQCTLWCQRCDKAGCTECVTSSKHKGHEFTKIALKLEEQRSALKKEFEYFSKLLKTWKDALSQIQIRNEIFKDDTDKLGQEITRTADRVCDQVRRKESALQTELQGIKNTQRRVLQDQEDALASGIKKIKQKIKTTEDKLRSEDIEVILYYRGKEEREEMEKPPKENLPVLPNFLPGKIDIQVLEAMVGSISVEIKKKYTKTTAIGASREKTTATTQERSSVTSFDLPPMSSGTSASSKLSLLPSTTAVHIIQTNKSVVPSLVSAGLGQTWVRTDESRLQLMDIRGSVKKSTNAIFGVGDVTITHQGNLLISNQNTNSIKSLSENGNLQVLFNTEFKPKGICCLQNSDVLITFFDEGRVIEYSSAGKVVRELEKSLFRHPINVAQNKINKHIYVVDKSGITFSAPGTLMAFDIANGKLQYRYNGSDATPFTPIDVCTDQAGHIITTDYSSHRIHILDQDGKFLQYMMTKDQDLRYPSSIEIDSDGYVWVSEYKLLHRSKVKILKYRS